MQATEALEDPGLELKPRQVISKAPTMIPQYLAVSGRLVVGEEGKVGEVGQEREFFQA